MNPFAHNGLVVGSSPTGPTNQINDLSADKRGARGFAEPKRSSEARFPGSRMKWEWLPDKGYGWWLYVRLGKLWLTVGGYRGNWYFQLMWA